MEPITPEAVAKIIAKERPDALLPTLGGQTGLNTAVAVAEMGVLEKYGVEMIGATLEVIHKAEDREKFRDRHGENRPAGPPERLCPNHGRSLRRLPSEIGFPIIVRASFTLGGTGQRRGLQPGRTGGDRQGRAGCQHDPRNHAGGVGPGLEGIRTGGHAGQGGQRRHHLLHRES